MTTYFATRPFTENLVHHNISNKYDDMIPFVPFFITFYLLAFAQWIIGYVVIARENRQTCYRVAIAESTAKIICFLFFVLYPTTMVRPEIAGNGIFESLTQWIYDIDAPNNLFPSIHCLESFFVFRGAIGVKKVPKWYIFFMFGFSVCVFASTVLVKQHILLDIVGAIAAGEIGFLVSRLVFKRFKFNE